MSRHSRFWASNDEVRGYGGITSPRRFHGDERETLEYAQTIVARSQRELVQRYGSMKTLDFFFLDRREINAVVIQHGGRHGIGLCVGLPLRMRKRLAAAMRSPKFLPGYLTAAERPKWSWRFLGMIVEFAYLHEVAHAMRGHFAYLGGRAARGSSFCLDEQARRHGRYVELDADLHALEMWMDTTREAEDFPTTPTLLEELYFQRLFSAILLYQSLDQGGLSAREHERLGHPAPIHRSMLLSRAMFSSGRTYFGLTAERLREVHSQAQSEASVAARCWRLTKDRWWGGRDGLRREPEKYARQLHYYLTKVEPRIDALNATLPDTLV